MLTSLSELVKLKSLAIGVGFPPHALLLDQERRNQTLPTLVVLPALTRFEFQGVSRYLEDLCRIDYPLLDSICITFSRDFNPTQLAQFIRRTAWFDWFQTLNFSEAHVDFDYYGILVDSIPPTQAINENFRLRISWNRRDWDPSFLATFLISLFSSIYIVKHLYVHGSEKSQEEMELEDGSEDMRWLEILEPLTAVKKLYVCTEFAEYLPPACNNSLEKVQ